MAKPSLLLIGYRAYGDWVYTVPILPYLFERYEVHLETTMKGHELFHEDPRFSGISVFEFGQYPKEQQEAVVKERWEALEAELKPDKVINLWQSLETQVVCEDWMPIFWEPAEKRREEYGDKNMYESVFKHAGIPFPDELALDSFHFTEKQTSWGEKWRKSHEGEFLILMGLAGSNAQKIYPYMRDLTYGILDKYPNSRIYLIGDMSTANIKWSHERIVHAQGKTPIKQSFLMTKHADMVIAPETGLAAAAGMFGTHKIMLCTSNSPHVCCHHQPNDHSMQSSADCSPCFRAIYGIEHCEGIEIMDDEDKTPYCKCIFGFDNDEIMKVVQTAYQDTNLYEINYIRNYVDIAGTAKGKEIFDWRWGFVMEHTESGKLLDYGCGSGVFHGMAPDGFKANGFDVNPFSGFTDEPASDEVDILAMWDVIEHLKDPMEPIKKYRPEWVFITTPNVASGAAMRDFEGWKHNKPGEHINLLDMDELTLLLYEAGYDVMGQSHGEGEIRNPDAPDDILTIAARRMVA